MPRTITIEKTLFSFDELSDDAKERARDWYRLSREECYQGFDCEIDEFATICEMIGIDLDTHEVELMSGKKRREPNIYWSLGYSQSDYAAFEGTYDYKPDACLKLREINNDDSWKPLQIAIALARIQADNAFGIRAVMKCARDRMRLYECFDRRNEERDVSNVWPEIEGLMRDLANYLYDQLRAEDTYLNSDAVVDENIMADECTFDEEGERV